MKTNWRTIQLLSVSKAVSMLGSQVMVFTLILRGKDSGAAAIGALFVSTQLPTIVFAAWSGWLADRYSTKSLIPVLSIAQAVTSLALIRFSSTLTVLALVFFSRSFGTVVNPAWTAVTPQLVTKEDLPRAMGLQQSYFSTAQMLGPALGGFLVATTGYTWPFIIDAASFLFLATVPFTLRVNREGHILKAGHKMRASEGFRFIFEVPLLRSITVLLTMFILTLGVINIGLVFLVLDLLHGSASQYGLIESSFAIGSVLGGIGVSAIKIRKELHPRMIVTGLVILGIATLGVSLSWNWIAILIGMLVSGIGQSIMNAYVMGILMDLTPEEKLGRVSAAINGVVNVGMVAAMGIAGLLITPLGVRQVLVGGSIVSIISLAIFGPSLLRNSRINANG
ncbi:MAG: MFS transporter [Actinobacteria bacterium]|nr:MFS transporter [Actinomycetota bacterium]